MDTISFKINVIFNPTGSVNIEGIRYGESTEVAKLFKELKRVRIVEKALKDKPKGGRQ